MNKKFISYGIPKKNTTLVRSVVNDVIFAEKPYEMGIIQILIQE